MNVSKKKPEMTPAQKRQQKLKRLRWACRVVVLATAGTSIWANELHSQGGWQSAILAALPPGAALLAWELVSRIPMRSQQTRLKQCIRATRPLATVGLFFGAAWLSYWHQRAAVYQYTRGDLAAAIVIPLLIDGLMIVTSVSIFELNEQMEEIEAHLTGAALALPKSRPEEPVRRSLTGKERVAQILAKNPTITVPTLAAKAGLSEAYVYALAKELRSGNGAELVDVDA